MINELWEVNGGGRTRYNSFIFFRCPRIEVLKDIECCDSITIVFNSLIAGLAVVTYVYSQTKCCISRRPNIHIMLLSPCISRRPNIYIMLPPCISRRSVCTCFCYGFFSHLCRTQRPPYYMGPIISILFSTESI
jgi:hypothetical protein